MKEVRDNGLKLFLEKEELEKLYDFEEECVSFIVLGRIRNEFDF